MDAHNLFETPATYRLIRLEYALGLVVATALFLTHLDEVRRLPALALFVYIDLIGYLPGAIAHRRAGGRRISRTYHVLYNVMHSLVTQGLVALAWIWLFGAEWALLALPIHLFGDRALFGNFLKPFGLRFEPETHPAYERFRHEYAALSPEIRETSQTRETRGTADTADAAGTAEAAAAAAAAADQEPRLVDRDRFDVRAT